MAGDPLVMSSIVSPTSELISKCINESGLFGDLSVPDYNQGLQYILGWLYSYFLFNFNLLSFKV
jgi:hypothetical protein